MEGGKIQQINKGGGWNLSKSVSVGSTFIREMRVLIGQWTENGQGPWVLKKTQTREISIDVINAAGIGIRNADPRVESSLS